MKPAVSNSLASRAEVRLRPNATRAAVERFCAEAIRLGLCGVLVPTSRVELARDLLDDSQVKVIAMVDFPWGAADPDVRRYEVEAGVDLGAQEVQLVLPTPRLKDGERIALLREMRDIVEAADERPVNYFLETYLLTAEEIRTACELALDGGLQGIAAGSICTAPPDAELICGLRALIGPKFLLKVAGVFTETETPQRPLDAGADRIQGGEEILALLAKP